MPPLWTRLLASAVLVAIGVMIGMFYTERQYWRAATPPLVADSYVRHSACPSETLERMNQVLANDDIAVPSKASREIEADRRALIAELCPRGRRAAPDG